MLVETVMLEGFILRNIWRTNQVLSMVRYPSEDLNLWLWAIYDSRYSHQDYDSVLGGVHELSYSNININ